MPIEKRSQGYSEDVARVAQKLGLTERVNTETTQISQILTGWANVVKDKFNSLDPDLKELGEARMTICNGCDLRVGGTCSPHKTGTHVETGEIVKGCGCGLAAKTLSPTSHCPLGRW